MNISNNPLGISIVMKNEDTVKRVTIIARKHGWTLEQAVSEIVEVGLAGLVLQWQGEEDRQQEEDIPGLGDILQDVLDRRAAQVGNKSSRG